MKKLAFLGVVALLSVGVFWFCRTPRETERQSAVFSSSRPNPSSRQDDRPTRARAATDGRDAGVASDGADVAAAAKAEDLETRADEEEQLVTAFDDLTDRWMAPSPKGVSLADVDNFARSFRKIPKARRDECIHRALNLIPDENVMLLAGVLMDKTADREVVETVYNDILNRDEDVKKPILQEIFKDKTHPCWADTAWILDVTGELPQAK